MPSSILHNVTHLSVKDIKIFFVSVWYTTGIVVVRARSHVSKGKYAWIESLIYVWGYSNSRLLTLMGMN